MNRIGNFVVAQLYTVFLIMFSRIHHRLLFVSLPLSISLCFFHYCIDARTTQYYLPLLATTICLIDLYFCTWFIAICVHVVGQVTGPSRWSDRRTFNLDIRFKTRAKLCDIRICCVIHEETRERICTRRDTYRYGTKETLRRKSRYIETRTSHTSTGKHYNSVTTRHSAFTECCNQLCFCFLF